MNALPSISLLVSTYNWPQALTCVLDAIRRQRHRPLEVIIADDGSGEDTRAVIERAARAMPVPVAHVWHPDEGFRAAAIRNRGLAIARGDYIVQIDGDILLHPEALGAHARWARPGSFVQGSRALLSPAATQRVLQQGSGEAAAALRPWHHGIGGRLNAWYAPVLAPLVRGTRDPVERIRGCHLAYWRDDMQRVNGYDASYVGWGREDSDFTLRLGHAGVVRRNLKFAAVAFHLWHPPAARYAVDQNSAALDAARRERRIRARSGLAESAAAPMSCSPESS